MQLASAFERADPSRVMPQAFPPFSSISGYTDSCLNRQLADWNGSLAVMRMHSPAIERTSLRIQELQTSRVVLSQEYSPGLTPPSTGVEAFQLYRLHSVQHRTNASLKRVSP